MASHAPATNPLAEPILINPDKSFADITAEVAAPIEKKPGMLWWIFFGISLLLTGQFAAETPNRQKGVESGVTIGRVGRRHHVVVF